MTDNMNTENTGQLVSDTGQYLTEMPSAASVAEMTRQALNNITANGNTGLELKVAATRPATVAELINSQNSKHQNTNGATNTMFMQQQQLQQIQQQQQQQLQQQQQQHQQQHHQKFVAMAQSIGFATKNAVSQMGFAAIAPKTEPPDYNSSCSSNMFPLEEFNQTPLKSPHVSNGGGPIRNSRSPAQRLLRPGIDNLDKFQMAGSPGVMVHAMELLRQKDRKKRGLKEKETFHVFIYCLPNKGAKLPKFSSLDPVQRMLVDEQQKEGYGYPAQDYINGIPRKTQLSLSETPEMFHSFLVSIYPRLDGRMFDLYRIDKTRRLVRIDVQCPRQLKDMKYQGSVIIIPYDTTEDRPQPVIHRHFDECFTQVLQLEGYPSPNFNVPLAALPESSVDNMDTSIGNFRADKSGFPGQPISMTFPNSSERRDSSEERSSTSNLGAKFPVRNGGNGAIPQCSEESQQSSSSQETNPLDNIQILNKAGVLRSQLKSPKRIHIKPEALCEDILDAYRTDTNLEHHKLAICFQQHNPRSDDAAVQHDDDVEPGAVIVMFWEEVLRKHFHGDKDLVPILDPAAPLDLFKLLGRIFYHGLVLANYVPIKFSVACVTYILTDSCSDMLLLSSLYSHMSEAEKMVLELSMEEIRSGLGQFSDKTATSLKIILSSYGCKHVPNVRQLELMMPRLAKSFLIHQLYWPLLSIRRGFNATGSDIFSDVTEEDVVELYQELNPVVPSLLEHVTYLYSSDDTTSEGEKRVKDYFEQYIFKLSKNNLLRLLYQWCGYDCLCVPDLYVKFSGEDRANSMASMFFPRQAMLVLPSACTSPEELRTIISEQLMSLTCLDV